MMCTNEFLNSTRSSYWINNIIHMSDDQLPVNCVKLITPLCHIYMYVLPAVSLAESRLELEQTICGKKRLLVVLLGCHNESHAASKLKSV